MRVGLPGGSVTAHHPRALTRVNPSAYRPGGLPPVARPPASSRAGLPWAGHHRAYAVHSAVAAWSGRRDLNPRPLDPPDPQDS